MLVVGGCPYTYVPPPMPLVIDPIVVLDLDDLKEQEQLRKGLLEQVDNIEIQQIQ